MYGAPGEEMAPPDAKTEMYKAGVFTGADVLVRSHGTSTTTRPAPGFGTCCMNIVGAKYTFHGAPAHQMTAWNGRNALTAVVHLFVNIDGIRSNLRPEARVQGVIVEGGAAPNVVPDRTVADFYIHPDAVPGAGGCHGRRRGAGRRARHRDACRHRSLLRGTRRRVRRHARGSWLCVHEEVRRHERAGRRASRRATRKPDLVPSAIPGLGFSAQSRRRPNHTYEMESDALAAVGHHGFTVDAQAMAAVLFDSTRHPDYRAAVQREFEGIHALFGEYQTALRKAYPVPKVNAPQ
ncbi:MAG: peptidase dimerization domain-containing protein [Gemmatimonadaceae bacterium]